MRKFVAPALIQLGFLAACGGGGGYTTPPPPPPTQMIATPGPPNVETLTVNAGPAMGLGTINTAYISVQVCNPTTGACQTITDIEVDTGSTGLRLLASAMNGLILPVETNGTNPLAECLQHGRVVVHGVERDQPANAVVAHHHLVGHRVDE